MTVFRVCISVNEEEEILSQIQQRLSWIKEQMGMMKLGVPDTNHCHMLLTGAVNLKATTTVIVFAKTVERATVKTTLNVTC